MYNVNQLEKRLNVEFYVSSSIKCRFQITENVHYLIVPNVLMRIMLNSI